VAGEGVAVVRRFFEALDAGEDGFALADPDLVYVEDPKWPGSGTFHGRDAVRDCWLGYTEVLGAHSEISVEEIRSVGGEVVAVVRVFGASAETQIPFDHTWGYVCRAAEGRLSYLRAYFDPGEALAAASARERST
jgi:ketosteroid isomerase-like protein